MVKTSETATHTRAEIHTDWIPTTRAKPTLVLSRGAIVADRYRIEQPLGAGGSGVVYRAHDQVLDHRVALKLLGRGSSVRACRRFRREVALAQRLHHPGVVRVYDIGRSGDTEYFTMEYIEGESLAARLGRVGPLAVDQAIELFAEVADAVAHLHNRGVIHRDIKPANILIEARTGRARLVDFGLARLQDSTGTQSASSIAEAIEMSGTPWYMSPEQMLGLTPDARSDIYALGASCYELLTGHKPHRGATPSELAARKHAADPAPIRSLRPDVPRHIAQVITRCLARNPKDRFGSMTKVAEALRIPDHSTRQILRLDQPRAAVCRRVWLGAALLLAAAAGLAGLV